MMLGSHGVDDFSTPTVAPISEKYTLEGVWQWFKPTSARLYDLYALNWTPGLYAPLGSHRRKQGV